MLAQAELGRVLVTLPTHSFRGTLWRAVHDAALHDPAYPPAPLYCKGAVVKGGRYTAIGGPPSLYLAENKLTADSEANQIFKAVHNSFPALNFEPPTTTFHVNCHLERVLDISNPDIQAALGTNLPELIAPWRFFQARGLLAPTQQLGQAISDTNHAQAVNLHGDKPRGF